MVYLLKAATIVGVVSGVITGLAGGGLLTFAAYPPDVGATLRVVLMIVSGAVAGFFAARKYHLPVSL